LSLTQTLPADLSYNWRMLCRLILLICSGIVLVACEEAQRSVEIRFEARQGGQAISCESPGSTVSLTDLRFYVSQMYLFDSSGIQVPVELNPDDTWQTKELALVDLEDGRGDCLNGTPGTNSILYGSVRGESFQGLAFEIGVPESLNHGDPLVAEAPLTNTPMHWHWRSGYKFLRVGVKTASDGFWMHVGSARCSGTIGNLIGCQSSNRVSVLLPDFVPGRDAVVIDLDKILATIDLGDGLPGDCSSGPDETQCAGPFGALGIDFANGGSVGPARAVDSAAFLEVP